MGADSILKIHQRILKEETIERYEKWKRSIGKRKKSTRIPRRIIHPITVKRIPVQKRIVLTNIIGLWRIKRIINLDD